MAPAEKPSFAKASEGKEGYWTPLEKQVRDYFFLPITWPFKFVPYAANLVTLTGFGILFYSIYNFSVNHDYKRQVWLLVAAWLTDLFDGPIARNNNNVTAIGTAGDHIRDYFISAWMIALAFFITADYPQFWPMKWILIFTIAGLLGVISGTLLLQYEIRKEKRGLYYAAFVKNFLLEDLVTSVTARIHTAVIAFAGVFYIAGAAWDKIYLETGVVLFITQLFILGFYIHEIFQARYENQAYKIRMSLVAKVQKFEKLLAEIHPPKFSKGKIRKTKK